MEQNFCERRKHARLLLSLPMQVQWINEEGRMFIESRKSVNVSTSGVYYKSREELEKHESDVYVKRNAVAKKEEVKAEPAPEEKKETPKEEKPAEEAKEAPAEKSE